MDKELLNPFVNATLHVLKTMCGTTAVVGVPSIKEGSSTWGDVTGIIGLSSDRFTGNLALSFDKSAILSIVSSMLSESFLEITGDVADAVGEITNMVTGGAKQQLAEQGHIFSMATPIMIVGRGVGVSHLSKAQAIQVPFTIDAGGFVIEAGLVESVRQS